tara:strand:+ start:3252 stop:3431 length:180 start_codon:yes stop_codon:yes gene_type:complete
MTKEKVAFITVAVSLIPGLYWLGGYNFDSRGVEAAGCVIFSLFFFIGSLIFSSDFDEKL